MKMKRIDKKGASNVSFKDYAIYTLLASVVIVALFRFAVGMGGNYGVDLSIDDNKVNMTGLETAINNTSAASGANQQSFTGDNFFEENGDIGMFSIWGVMKSVWSGIIATFRVLIEGSYNVLRINPIVLGAIIAILTFSLIFMAWRTVRSGE